MSQFPAYIEKADLAGTPITFKWTGRLDHIGPIEGTALHDAVESLTHCGAVLLASVLERWAVYRFHGGIEPQPYLAQADAVLAWTIDPAYSRPGKVEEIETPPAKSAMSVIAEFVWGATEDDYRENPATEYPSGVVHVAFLVKHILPKEKAKPFDTWMKWALNRLKAIAPRPVEILDDYENFESDKAYDLANRPYFGEPLPLEVLNPEFDYQPENREELLDRFLQSLDWKTNPFLRSPSEMKKRGFKGTPYRLG